MKILGFVLTTVLIPTIPYFVNYILIARIIAGFLYNKNVQFIGGNKPPVVLLHGLMLSGACWTPLAQALKEDYDVIMPDARGRNYPNTTTSYGLV